MPRILIISLLAAAAIGQNPSAAPSTATSKGLELATLLDWERVGNPQFSPDGTRIVYTRSWTDKVNDRMQSELWIMARNGDGQRFLTEGGSPRWSPDGTRIAFTRRGKPDGTQIHVMHLDDRSVTQVTRLTEGPGNLRWSPNGRSLAFSMQVQQKDGFPIKLPKRPKGAKWAPEPTVITRLNYRSDRRGYRPSGFRHLFVVDATGGTPRQITSGDFDHGGGEWTPDGKALVFSGLRAEDADWQVRESEVYAVTIDSGEVQQLTTRTGPDRGPIVSPDGKWIAYTGFDTNRDTYNVSSIYVMARDGSNPRALTAAQDRSPGSLIWSADSSAIYYTTRDRGMSHAFKVTRDGEITQLVRGNLQFRLADVDFRGALLGTETSPHRPSDIVLRHGEEQRQLTNVHADVLGDVELGAVEEFWTASADGLKVQGWIVKPPDFDPTKQYPLILQIHGGPHGMYGVNFDFERQNHAANGYVVVYTNPRGSLGYGKQFGNAINNAYPGQDYDDLMACVDHVIAQGYIDTDNLFVYGGSGGGVLTCWIVGKTDRFAAAVSMFPVTNWISFVGTTDGPYWYTNFEKLPWEGIEEHWRRSPLRLVGNVTTPTMLITGELDLRTPMAQTEEYYQALRLRKIDSVMVRVPDEYHGAAGRHVSNRMRRILYVRGWFERYRKNDSENAAANAPKNAAPAEASSGRR
ncbi:MAG: S9 family peptidase [bacterium]|nr:S9 family peptidase [bacterium]